MKIEIAESKGNRKMSGPLFVKNHKRTYANPHRKAIVTDKVQPTFSQILNFDNSCLIDIDIDDIESSGEFEFVPT